MLHGTWDLPGPGIKPLSPALAGGFLTTVPPGKPNPAFLNWKIQLLAEVSRPRTDIAAYNLINYLGEGIK